MDDNNSLVDDEKASITSFSSLSSNKPEPPVKQICVPYSTPHDLGLKSLDTTKMIQSLLMCPSEESVERHCQDL